MVKFLFASACLASSASALAAPSVLLELFTSQGCYSCPPAEKLMAERYLEQGDVLVLEMHVDYWDELVYGGSSWKDPFSSRTHTDRQRRYSQTTLRSPYTPQAIVQGAYSASGTDRNGIDHAINQVRKLGLTDGWDIRLENKDGKWVAQVISSPSPAEVLVVTYLREAKTKIAGGENKGKLLHNNNVVTDLRSAGLARAGQDIDLGSPDEREGCALILQRPDQGVVLGVWRCGQEGA